MHGDDFTALGNGNLLTGIGVRSHPNVRQKVKGRMGPGKEDLKSMRALNRVIHWTASGIEYDVGQRHVEIIVRELGLESDSKSVETPGIVARWSELEAAEELDATMRTWYRGIVARGNYFAQDRCDIQYAVKELPRGMASPNSADLNALKRLTRYLMGRTRYIIRYERQRRTGIVEVQVKTDHAGCLRTRKSTSGAY